MNEVTRILSAVEQGNPQAAEQLLPLVYNELRKLAAQRLTQENPGQTLQATALVHEAYLRLVDTTVAQRWDNRGHFFAAAAEAMRRILIENARRKSLVKHGVRHQRIDLDEILCHVEAPADHLLALDDALTRLEATDSGAAALVKLRYFAGLTMPEAAATLGVPLRTAERNWTFARTWLHQELSPDEADHPQPDRDA
jgi:RNA polymerase sigma factor (TIGR02999 family)